MPRRQNTTSAARLARANKQAQAVKLRAEGKTFEQIGKALKIGKGTACTYVMDAIAEANKQGSEIATDLIAHEWKITTALLETFVPLAMEGDAEANREVCRLLDRRARYRGLDAPVKTDSNVTEKIGIGLEITHRFLNREQMQDEVLARVAKLTAPNPN